MAKAQEIFDDGVSSPKHSRLSILVIDDDKVDRQQIKRIFRDSVFEVDIEESEDLKSALKLLAQNSYDCVLIDFRMPVLDGLTGLKEIQKIDTHLPVVMITGQGDEMIAVEALQAGAYNYLPKDRITSEMLWNAINASIENSRLKRKIEQQREELENFGRILAHDLKAPIRVIVSFKDMIQQAINSENYDKVEKYFDHVDKAARSMDMLIDTLGEYNKLDQDNVKFDTVSMSDVVNSVINNLSVVIADTNANISFGQLPDIRGNAPQLVQLLQNLIANAIKYCEAGNPDIDIQAEEQDDSWVISVKDNGIGIPEKYAQKIFEPFKRLHASHQYSGSGLGLATCTKIVKRHDGSIWCEPGKDDGSIFYIKLPKT